MRDKRMGDAEAASALPGITRFWHTAWGGTSPWQLRGGGRSSPFARLLLMVGRCCRQPEPVLCGGERCKEARKSAEAAGNVPAASHRLGWAEPGLRSRWGIACCSLLPSECTAPAVPSPSCPCSARLRGKRPSGTALHVDRGDVKYLAASPTHPSSWSTA